MKICVINVICIEEYDLPDKIKQRARRRGYKIYKESPRELYSRHLITKPLDEKVTTKEDYKKTLAKHKAILEAIGISTNNIRLA